MNIKEFEESLNFETPPVELSDELRAVWYFKKQDWEKAHEVAQNIPGVHGDWIHGFLHWIEGDISNAKYWYRSSGRPWPTVQQNEELERLLNYFLSGSTENT